MTEKNKEIVRGFLETVYNDHKPEEASEFIADDAFIQNGMHSWDGVKGYQEYMEPAFEAFPDYSLTVEEIFAKGDKVAFRFSDSGTMKGEYQGLEPTGREFSLSVVGIAHIENGKITELRYEYDRLQMMQQLGASP
ncbi:MAG: ester cyclase [Halobacteria archaeon]|nr:ester cyclase [Halobacteria archaeon]